MFLHSSKNLVLVQNVLHRREKILCWKSLNCNSANYSLQFYTILFVFLALLNRLNSPDSMTVAYFQIFEGFYHLIFNLYNPLHNISVNIFTPDRPGSFPFSSSSFRCEFDFREEVKILKLFSVILQSESLYEKRLILGTACSRILQIKPI